MHSAAVLLTQHHDQGAHYRSDDPVELVAGENRHRDLFAELIATEKELMNDHMKAYERHIAQHKPYLLQYIEEFDKVNQLLEKSRKDIVIDYETTDEKFYLRSVSSSLKRKINSGILYTNSRCNWQQHCPIIREYACEEMELKRLSKDANAYLKK